MNCKDTNWIKRSIWTFRGCGISKRGGPIRLPKIHTEFMSDVETFIFRFPSYILHNSRWCYGFMVLWRLNAQEKVDRIFIMD